MSAEDPGMAAVRAPAAGEPLRVLVTAPDSAKVGGISNYLNVCHRYHGDGIEYVTRGARAGERGALRAAWRIVADVWRLARRIRSGGHVLVHQNTSLARRGLIRDAVVLLLARAAGKPVLVFFHGWDHGLAAGIRGPSLWLMRRTYLRADAIVVLASEFRDQLRGWGYAGPVYLETTVVEDALVPAERPAGMREAPVQVLFMARLEPEKGCLSAIQAVERLVRRGADVRLVVAGDGTGRAEAEAYVRDRGLDFVRFVGFVRGDARRALLQGSDLYLFPTRHGEGMPTTVLEAMACGLPVVTRPVGGIRDFFEDGRMGALTESLDPEAFARLLEPLVSDPALRREVGAYNARYARERFTATRVVERMRGIYRETCRTS